MARIVITEFMDAPAVARLAAAHDVVNDATLVDDPVRLLALGAGADAIVVRNRTQVRGDLLAALKRCRVVGRLGVGLDNIDVDTCRSRGIDVIAADGANAQSVAEYVVTAALVLLRGAYARSADVAAGRWPRAALGNGRELAGTTLALIGFGTIGQLTARLARALGMTVVAHDALRAADDPLFASCGVQPLALNDALARADVVSLHVPLIDSTRNLFDATRIAAMKPGAVLVNTARGGIVDDAALAQALRSGHLGGAAIDVFTTEPLPAQPLFEGVPNLLLTPHIAGVTCESNQRVSALIAERVLLALR